MIILDSDDCCFRHNQPLEHHAAAGNVCHQQPGVLRVRLSGRVLHPHDRHGSNVRADGAATSQESALRRIRASGGRAVPPTWG